MPDPAGWRADFLTSEVWFVKLSPPPWAWPGFGARSGLNTGLGAGFGGGAKAAGLGEVDSGAGLIESDKGAG